MYHKLKLQLFFVLLKVFNIITNLLLFHLLKRNILRMVGFRIGKKVAIHGGIRIFSFNKFIVGNNSTINFGCYLDNRRGITIGSNVSIAHDVKIYTLGHDINDPEFKTKGSPVLIHDNVVIFAQVLIMPGVTVGEGAVILPGSIVIKNIEPYTVVGGNPARVIKNRKKEISYSIDYRYIFAN